MSPSGGERILAILGPGALVGELAMIDAQPRSASVTAARDSELSFISRAAFEQVAAAHPDVYRHIVRLLVRRLRDTNNVVAAMSFLSLKGRVAQALLSLAEAFGNDVGSGRILIRQKVTQSDLAAMAGIARENVSRILNDWMRAEAGEPARRLLLPGEPRRAGDAKPRCEVCRNASRAARRRLRQSVDKSHKRGNACRSFWARASIAIAWSRTGRSCPTAGT